MDRLSDLVRFYILLGSLEEKLGGKRTLAVCNGRMSWPTRGVYFFFEAGEERCDSGHGPRIVRVGTHALTAKKVPGRNRIVDAREKKLLGRCRGSRRQDRR